MDMPQTDFEYLSTKLLESISTETELEIVKLASELAAANHSDLAGQFKDIFVACSTKLAHQKKRKDLIRDLEDLILYCVKRAVDAHIERHGHFEVNVDSGHGTSPLDEDVVESCGVRFNAAWMVKLNEYEIVGHLVTPYADHFNQNAAHYKFVVKVYHEFGCDKNGFFFSSQDFYCCIAEWLYYMEVQQLEDAIDRLEMLINFYLKTTVEDALAYVRGI